MQVGNKNQKPFPLPPRKEAGSPKKRRRPLHRRAIHAAVAAPGKLMQRVNEELYKRNAELRARNKTLALLRELDEISLATVSTTEMAQQTSAAIAAALGYDLVTIAVVEAGQALHWLACASSVPWITSALKAVNPSDLTLPLNSGLASLVSVKGQSVQYADDPKTVYPAALIDRLRGGDETPQVEEVKHTVLFPLRFGDQRLGLLTLSSSRPFQTISQFEQESVTGIVGLVSLAMYKAKIYEDLQATSAKLAEANEQLKDLDKVKSEFFSLASHQLYTPLTALRGYLSMLKEGDFGAIPDKQAPIIQILDKSATRLISLIKMYLDLSRIEAGRLELKLEALDLVEMAKQLVQDLMPNAIAKHLQLQFLPPQAAVPPVVADRERIRQVLLNFVDNAIKYTSEGAIDVQVRSEGAQAVFSVTDSGRGMTAEEIKRLFTKFTRVGGADRLRAEGTGLGLYLAQKMVQEHRGEVRAESGGRGRGSTFSMVLPAEGSSQSLKVGEQATVEIKAAESQPKPAGEKTSN